MTAKLLVGTTLPEGRWTITRADNERLIDVIGTAPEYRHEVHPLWAYLCAHRGIGIDIDGILELAEFTAAEGPMAGSFELQYLGPIEFDVEYRVTGEITGNERKHGRKTGPFDVLSFCEHLIAPDGEEVAKVELSWILPRRNG